MEVLRAEFGRPEIEPHIPVEGSIYMMSREDAFNEFRSAPLCNIVAKVDQVVTRNYHHQCVSRFGFLTWDTLTHHQIFFSWLFPTAKTWSRHFGFYNSKFHAISAPPLRKLTEEKRKKAREIVNVLDESITSLSFPVTRYALYEIDYNDKSLKSWTKIAEIGH
ncbi:cyclic phosphodiesterase-like [Pyrus ussuriensis x Pyrus communis]|uniref:Cyclic phosphodiesterase-like n=1 Tax=Pyrus ussuriensis x Pyrus communis TaxID=2448454 RepID=A0A5N5GVB5_9ROSA|nr:cyclic phosphodiesterase-like [Pyrus ussuriensis x Pyrus communis]